MGQQYKLGRQREEEITTYVKIILKSAIIFHGINQKKKKKRQRRKKISRILYLYYNCVTEVLHLRYNWQKYIDFCEKNYKI